MTILGEQYDEYLGFAWDQEPEDSDWRGYPEEPEDRPEED